MQPTWQVSASQWIFGDESISRTVGRLERLGYDAVELVGEPDEFTGRELAALKRGNLRIASVCGMYSAERDLSHPDSRRRKLAQEYVRRCVDLQAQFGEGVVIVVPTAVGRIQPLSTREAELEYAAESLQSIAARTEGSGVRIVVEALNRYETYLVNTLQAAFSLAETTQSDRVGVILDTFHMNIEEQDPVTLIESIRSRLWHVQLADSNRLPPGQGHISFQSILDRLRGIGYAGSLAMEYLPAAGNPYDVRSLSVSDREKDSNARAALMTIRACLSAQTE